MSALAGLRVVELAGERCAFAGKLLGDMGADVVLVEPPGGDASRAYPPFAGDEPGADRSLYWWHYNTSKRGLVLDLEREAARRVFAQLIASADVLIEAEAPGRLARLGLDYADLVAHRPDLIHVSITPFGRTSSRRDEPATDLTILAGGGPVWSCGYDDHSLPPIRGGGNQGHQIACHYAVMSALTALLHRGVSGQGQFVDVSMHAAANVTTEMASYCWLVDGTTVQRQTGRHAMPQMTMPVQIRCGDGRHATTGVPPRTPAGFGVLYDWLDSLGLVAQLPEAIFLDRARERESIHFAQIGVDDEVTAIFAAARDAIALVAANLPAHEFFVGAQERNITVGAIYSPEEAYEDAHFVARGFPVEVEHPELGRRVRYPGAPYKLPASPWAISRRAPRLGEHAQEILDELGVDDATRREVA
ncbi:MAG TPA: CoA transferase [Myxococcota bacterium]|nr:CoA transferase [Myxococcales bacterium]HPG25124.1 CoA transferase [Myxococcota bacterium]